MKKNPDITILMSVRDGELFIKEAVSSILNQTYTNFILLIVDNASTDKTRSIIKDFKDPRIQLVELSNDIGQASALNKGLSMIKTEFIARMDADDISVDDRLNKQRAYIIKNKLDLVGSNGIVIDENGNDLYSLMHPLSNREIINTLNIGCPLIHSSVFMKKSVQSNVGLYNNKLNYAEDWELWIRFAQAGYQIGNLNDKLVKLRRHKNQASSNRSNKILIYTDHKTILESKIINPIDEEYNDFIWSMKIYTIFRLVMLKSFKAIFKNKLDYKITYKSLKLFIKHIVNDYKNNKFSGRADIYNNYSLVPPRKHIVINNK